MSVCCKEEHKHPCAFGVTWKPVLKRLRKATTKLVSDVSVSFSLFSEADLETENQCTFLILNISNFNPWLLYTLTCLLSGVSGDNRVSEVSCK